MKTKDEGIAGSTGAPRCLTWREKLAQYYAIKAENRAVGESSQCYHSFFR